MLILQMQYKNICELSEKHSDKSAELLGGSSDVLYTTTLQTNSTNYILICSIVALIVLIGFIAIKMIVKQKYK